jgi:hypothetical protein
MAGGFDPVRAERAQVSPTLRGAREDDSKLAEIAQTPQWRLNLGAIGDESRRNESKPAEAARFRQDLPDSGGNAPPAPWRARFARRWVSSRCRCTACSRCRTGRPRS